VLKNIAKDLSQRIAQCILYLVTGTSRKDAGQPGAANFKVVQRFFRTFFESVAVDPIFKPLPPALPG
jgi:hypothetical protein